MPKVIRGDQVRLRPVQTEGARGARMAELIAEREGAPSFAMRLFELGPGGATPLHSHQWEHEVYILEGEGRLLSADGEQPLRSGDAVFVPAEEQHSFASSPQGALRFLCLIPVQGGGCR